MKQVDWKVVLIKAAWSGLYSGIGGWIVEGTTWKALLVAGAGFALRFILSFINEIKAQTTEVKTGMISVLDLA